MEENGGIAGTCLHGRAIRFFIDSVEFTERCPRCEMLLRAEGYTVVPGRAFVPRLRLAA